MYLHWIYKIKRKLHGGLKVWILSSCGIYIYIYSKTNQQTDACGNIYRIFHGGANWRYGFHGNENDENKPHTVPSYLQATVKFSFYYIDSMQKL